MSGPRAILGVFEQMASAAVAVRQERCAKVRNRNISCLRCAEACTSGCISFADGELTITADRCVGCGTCATVCPTCALEARNPSDTQLLTSCANVLSDDAVVIVCEQLCRAAAAFIDPNRTARVVCLGRVDESLIVGLAARGALQIDMTCGDCGRCEQSSGLTTAVLVAETANALLEAWGSKARASVVRGIPARALAHPGQIAAASDAVAAYFSKRRGNAPVALAAMPLRTAFPTPGKHPLPRVMKDGTLPHFLPDRRESLLDSLAAFGEPKAKSISVRLWGRVTIDVRKCSSCRMCATFCPTGALRRFDSGNGVIGVDHFSGDCVRCGSCRDICPENAIILFDDTRPSHLLDGKAHRYVMRPRSVELNDAHQILNTMRQRIQGSIFER
jgi:ferredoxin